MGLNKLYTEYLPDLTTYTLITSPEQSQTGWSIQGFAPNEVSLKITFIKKPERKIYEIDKSNLTVNKALITLTNPTEICTMYSGNVYVNELKSGSQDYIITICGRLDIPNKAPKDLMTSIQYSNK